MMEIYGYIESSNNINGVLGVGGVIATSDDFDTKIIPYDQRITTNTNNITALQTEVNSLDSITESLTDDVNENIRDIEDLEANKADKSELPNVPSWAMQSNKPSYNASEISNDSGVTGQTVKDALDDLYNNLDTVATETATNTTNIATNTSDINQINQNLAKFNPTSTTRTELTVGTIYTATTNGYLYVLDSGSYASVFLDEYDVAFGVQSSTAPYNSMFILKGMNYRVQSGRGFFLAINPS